MSPTKDVFTYHCLVKNLIILEYRSLVIFTWISGAKGYRMWNGTVKRSASDRKVSSSNPVWCTFVYHLIACETLTMFSKPSFV